MSTIQNNADVADTETTTAPTEEFDATAAFLTSFEDKDKDAHENEPSGNGEDENEQDAPEGDTNDTEGSDDSPETDADDDAAGDDDKDKAFADDGAYVKLKVDGEEKEVPVKELTRLYGQEASLTRKSQEVAEQRKAVEAEGEKHAAALQVLLQRAQEKAKPFKAINWIAVSKDPNISAEEVTALHTEAQRALEDEAFLSQSLDGFMTEVHNQQHKTRVESAKACVKTLTTPGTDETPNPLHIEGWNDKTYDDTRAFGIKMGAPAEFVNTLTDPAAIKMMHMAMLFAKGASKVQTTKVNKTPKKIVKTSSSPAAARQNAPTANRKAAVQKLRSDPNRSGAAADAFFASFNIDDSE